MTRFLSLLILLLLLVTVLPSTISAQGDLGPRGAFSAGPTPSQLRADISNAVRMTVRNSGSGTTFEVRLGPNQPGSVSVSLGTGPTFISGGQSRDFVINVNPNGIPGPFTIPLQLWGDNDAGDRVRVENRSINVFSIIPPAAFSIVRPTAGDTVPDGNFNIEWNPSAYANQYDIEIRRIVNNNPQNPPVISQTALTTTFYSLNTTQLERGTNYQVIVYAVNEIHRVANTPGNHRFFVAAAPPPGEFTVTAPANNSSQTDRPSFNWTTSQGALTYTLHILPEENGLPSTTPLRMIPGLTGNALTWPDPPLPSNATYYAVMTSVGEGGGTRIGAPGQIKFNVPPAPQTLKSRWYFAEGAAFDTLDTYYLVANPSDFPLEIQVDLLAESGANRSFLVPVEANARQTIRVNDWVNNTGVSAVLRELSNRPFGAERTMYTLGPNRRWVGAHAVTGIAEPSIEWFLAEGATSAATATDRFETYVLVANPGSVDSNINATFFPASGSAIERSFLVPAGRRITIAPGTLDARLSNNSFSTRVRSSTSNPILVERAMWWRNSGSPYTGFVEGNASPGIPKLSSIWYFAEGNTSAHDQFLLFVNPTGQPASVTVEYLLETAEPATRNFVVGAGQRFTINVRYDALGISTGVNHGTVVRSSLPIAVERSMYFNVPGISGPMGGHNTIGSPFAAREWVLPEGAEFPEGGAPLKTYIAIINPTSTNARIDFEFLLPGGQVTTRTRNLNARRRLVFEADDVFELFNQPFSTVVRSTVPIVVERTMQFGIDVPSPLARVGATNALGIPIGDVTIDVSAAPVKDSAAATSTLLPAPPSPTPTPTVTPLVP